MSKAVLFLLAASLGGQTPPAQRMTLSVDRMTAGKWKAVDPATVFDHNDQVRFRFSTNFDGFLYVLNLNTSGKYELLFPREDTGENNRLAASQSYVLPQTKGLFRIAGPAGHDVLYFVVSPTNLASGSSAEGQPDRPYVPLPPPPARGKVPPSFQPRCDDSIFKARGECIDPQAGPSQVRENSPLPPNLESVRPQGKRELLFVQGEKDFVVSSPVPLDGPVIYEFRLAHR